MRNICMRFPLSYSTTLHQQLNSFEEGPPHAQLPRCINVTARGGGGGGGGSAVTRDYRICGATMNVWERLRVARAIQLRHEVGPPCT